MQIRMVREIKRRNVAQLMEKPNVVACGVGFKASGGEETDELCVIVSVTKKLPATQLAPSELIPRSLDDLSTDVQQTGLFEPGSPLQIDGAPRRPACRSGTWMGQRARSDSWSTGGKTC